MTIIKPVGSTIAQKMTSQSAGLGVVGAPKTREALARQAFDSYFLQAALEQALPKKSDAVFGRGFSGDVMRSMLAERVAAEISKRSDFSLTGKALEGFTPGHVAASDGAGAATSGALVARASSGVSGE